MQIVCFNFTKLNTKVQFIAKLISSNFLKKGKLFKESCISTLEMLLSMKFMKYLHIFLYHLDCCWNDPKFLDRFALTNSANPGQTAAREAVGQTAAREAV